MFGDNKAVVDSTSIPHFRLHKRHVALSYHHVHKAIASGMLYFGYMPSEENLADVLSKHWGYKQAWLTLRLLMFQGAYKPAFL